MQRLSIGLAVIAAAVISVTVWSFRLDALREARQQASGLATALAGQTTRTVHAVDLVVRDVQDLVSNMGLETPQLFERTLATPDTHQLLREKLSRLPQADALTLVGADGHLVSSSRSWPPPPVSVADRDYYAFLRDFDDAGLFIAEPILNRITGAWTIYLARRVSSSSGAFIGIVQATIEVSYFSGMFQSIGFSANELLALTRRDGAILVASGSSDAQRGNKSVPRNSPWHGVVNQGGGHYTGSTDFDGVERTLAVRLLREYPLVVNVGIDEGAVLARWRHQAIGLTLAGFIIVLYSMLLLHALKAKSRELEVTLNSMTQGIIMADAGRRVPVINRQAANLLGLPDDLLGKPITFDDILSFQCTSGEFGKDGLAVPAKVWEKIQKGGMSGEIPVYERIRPNGIALEIRTVPLPDGGLVRTYTDVTERKRAENQIRTMAFRDGLTGLANRALLHERLEEACARLSRQDEMFAVLCLDLDRFKAINDSLGHASGDAVLTQVAARIQECVRDVDLVARLGGDEFVIIQSGLDHPLGAIPLVHRILSAISAPFELNGQRLSIGTSIGIAVAPTDGATPRQILRSADLALYGAKRDGRGAYRFFEPEMQAAADDRRRMEAELREALQRDELELHYLPWINCASGRAGGCEALVRWRHPTRGLIGPTHFIPIAEESGLIAAVGDWVLRRATAEACAWPEDIKLSVNVSAAQFLGNDLAASVSSALAQSGLAAERLELEVTESVLLFERGDQRADLQQLRRQGVRIAIDDFGTGYSSFRYLNLFPFDRLKVDRSFVGQMARRPHCAAIVSAVTELGRSLNMLTTAVGVETQEQLALLKTGGCTDVQGYLFGQPARASEVRDLLSSFGSIHSAA
jgi:diguanylate cyclase (GGDEF)-like protein